MMSPLDAFVFEHCGQLNSDHDCNLIPAFFITGDGRDVVVGRLTYAGYQHMNVDGVDLPPGAKDPRQDFTDYFAGPKGFTGFGCGYELGVFMQFDDAGRLESATGNKSSACL